MAPHILGLYNLDGICTSVCYPCIYEQFLMWAILNLVETNLGPFLSMRLISASNLKIRVPIILFSLMLLCDSTSFFFFFFFVCFFPNSLFMQVRIKANQNQMEHCRLSSSSSPVSTEADSSVLALHCREMALHCGEMKGRARNHTTTVAEVGRCHESLPGWTSPLKAGLPRTSCSGPIQLGFDYLKWRIVPSSHWGEAGWPADAQTLLWTQVRCIHSGFLITDGQSHRQSTQTSPARECNVDDWMGW